MLAFDIRVENSSFRLIARGGVFEVPPELDLGRRFISVKEAIDLSRPDVFLPAERRPYSLRVID